MDHLRLLRSGSATIYRASLRRGRTDHRGHTDADRGYILGSLNRWTRTREIAISWHSLRRASAWRLNSVPKPQEVSRRQLPRREILPSSASSPTPIYPLTSFHQERKKVALYLRLLSSHLSVTGYIAALDRFYRHRPAFLTISLRCLYLAILAVGVGSVSATCAVGATILVDEQGHIVIDGSAQPMGVLGTDPDTHNPVLVYSLPFTGNKGQVILTDPDSLVSDIIRFPGNGTLEYYSIIKQQTALSAAANSNDTVIKVNSTKGYAAGDQIEIDKGAGLETRTIQSVGTSGATGSGITLTAPLTLAHASNDGVSEPL